LNESSKTFSVLSTYNKIVLPCTQKDCNIVCSSIVATGVGLGIVQVWC